MNDDKNPFNSINYFEDDCDLFINFAFFQFIHCLGMPLLKRISESSIKEDEYKKFFENLKIKCTFEEEIINNNKEYYLILSFENNPEENKDFSTFIYPKLKIRGKEINLNGKEDKYDEKTSKIRLSKKTINEIHVKVGNIKKCSNCELCYDDRGIFKDPTLNNLINLYLNYKNRKEYKNKIESFEEKINKPQKNDLLEDNRIFEIDSKKNNRIKYKNLKKGEIYFLQGPPGTGKTYAITRLIEENEYDPRFDKIIVSSYVHVAINNVIERTLKDFSFENKYHKFYDFYQYLTILYSNRALSKIENSVESELIELDKIYDEELYEKGQKIYKSRKNNSKKLIDDFDEKIEKLNNYDLKKYVNESPEKKLNSITGEKFKRLFKYLNKSGEEYIDYEKTFELVNELSNKYNREFVEKDNIDWGIVNYSNAIKNYSNVIFCTLSNLPKEIERQKTSDRILVIIDEASKSNIINYLLLLNHIENISLLIIGDPEQLNNSLVFDSNVETYSKIMAEFSLTDKTAFLYDNRNKFIIEDMKKILFKLIKNKDDKLIEKEKKLFPIGYEKNYESVLTIWKEILSETFYEKLFNSASRERRELLTVHRRSRKEIFELSRFLYPSTYTIEEKEVNDNLLISKYDVLTRIVIDEKKDKFKEINKIINDWKKQKDKVNEKMNMGIITFHNNYKREFEENLNIMNNDNISIYTTDSSQGEEFTTVILYLDLNEKGELGFLKDYHRINVAVSRAREQLIIIETENFINKYKKIKLGKEYIKFKHLIDNIHEIPERMSKDE